jgi:MATE family multidrug resistance protein
MGQLGEAHYIGAVAVGAMIFNMLYWGFNFLRMGTTGLTAQAEGSGDRDEVAASLIRALLIAAASGAAMITLQAVISAVAFYLIEGSEPVESAAGAYFDLRIWSAPAALANFAILGWFIGRGRAGTAMGLQVLLNGTNAGLDALFVLGFGWGIEGVAIGTVIAETLAAACGLWLAFAAIRRSGARAGRERVLEGVAFRRVISVNADIMIRSLCLLFALAWFTAKSAQAGDTVLAANAILLHFAHFSAYCLGGFAFSAKTLLGRAIGANTRTRFRSAVRLSSLSAVGISTLLSASFLALGGVYIDLLTVSPEVREAARVFLFWAALTPLAGVACFQLDGIFIGATRTADMRNMMILSLAAYLSAWLVLTHAFANHGLWAALILFYLVRAATLAVRYPALERNAFEAAAPHGSRAV